MNLETVFVFFSTDCKYFLTDVIAYLSYALYSNGKNILLVLSFNCIFHIVLINTFYLKKKIVFKEASACAFCLVSNVKTIFLTACIRYLNKNNLININVLGKHHCQLKPFSENHIHWNNEMCETNWY